MLFALDESGGHLLPIGDDGRVTGRVGCYDPVWHGRWGGIVSGDRATVNYLPCDWVGSVRRSRTPSLATASYPQVMMASSPAAARALHSRFGHWRMTSAPKPTPRELGGCIA